MLVLTRKSEQKIIIGKGDDAIEIVVLKISGEQVSLGIKAKPHIRVLRKELMDAIEEENVGGAITTDQADRAAASVAAGKLKLAKRFKDKVS